MVQAYPDSLQRPAKPGLIGLRGLPVIAAGNHYRLSAGADLPFGWVAPAHGPYRRYAAWPDLRVQASARTESRCKAAELARTFMDALCPHLPARGAQRASASATASTTAA
jgi:hypothetical protein